MPKGIYIHKNKTDEWKKKISLSNIGKHNFSHTKDSIQKISKNRKGKSNPRYCYDKLSISYKGSGNPFYGKKHSKETLKKISGENSYLWKGGITPYYKKIRMSSEYSDWRNYIFKRDNFTCQKCKISGGTLHPHHILNFSQHEDLRFAIDNGITLCLKCHMSFHKIFGKQNNTKEQLLEFLKI